MPSNYFFDTGFLTLAIINKLEGKWIRPWKEVRKQRKSGYTIEPILAETYYQLMKNGMNKEAAKNRIIQIKAINSLKVTELDDNDSFKAGYYRSKLKDFKLSLVDCFVLAIADKNKLRIYTTDSPLKGAANEINLGCEYLPP
jgi:hypothetical protein